MAASSWNNQFDFHQQLEAGYRETPEVIHHSCLCRADGTPPRSAYVKSESSQGLRKSEIRNEAFRCEEEREKKSINKVQGFFFFSLITFAACTRNTFEVMAVFHINYRAPNHTINQRRVSTQTSQQELKTIYRVLIGIRKMAYTKITASRMTYRMFMLIINKLINKCLKSYYCILQYHRSLE